MKTFPELLLTGFWAEYVAKWKDNMIQSPVARAKGFVGETLIEDNIAAFVYAMEEEHKESGLKRFAFGLLDPTQVTFDGKKWYNMPPPKHRPN